MNTTSIENSIRAAAKHAVLQAVVNCFPEVKRQVAAKCDDAFFADAYPHEIMSPSEREEVIDTFARDAVSRSINFVNIATACEIEKAILNA